MYKQPAFDHPLLKNHTLQLKPSSFPKGMKLAKAKAKPASFYGFNDTCPSGTVLVHRARKQDLIESQLLRNHFRAQAYDPTEEGHHDSNTGNWWVTYNDELPLGYFPKELLPKMDDYSDGVQMGGHVYSPFNVPSPPMGSGHPSNEGRNKAAYFIQVQFVDESNKLFTLNTEFIETRADLGDYYSIADDHDTDDTDKYVFAYGGVGGFTK
ncbi:protein neprosin-like [Curcuma longa]|uniref:protein neprosin-like n=1 Tax=Curcuma longa TaxID=136217 RepID=UPI003D9F99FC